MKQENKIAFLCPYFGKFPEHFDFFLKSCEKNPDCTWFIFTDDKSEHDFPNNVKVEYMILSDLKHRFQEKLGFEIKLESTRKLGDYKPLFGFLFSEYIRDYHSWGHIDLADSIYGRITHFLTNEILEKYDKTMVCGHMSIYKNTDEVNKRFMIPFLDGKSYKDIFSDETFYNFEEIAKYSITTIYKENHFAIKNMSSNYADISNRRFDMRLGVINDDFDHFYLDKQKNFIFSWEDGVLYQHKIQHDKVIRTEYMYFHMKRRKINVECPIEENKFILCPHGIVKYSLPTKKIIKKYDPKKIFSFPYLEEKFKKWKK